MEVCRHRSEEEIRDLRGLRYCPENEFWFILSYESYQKFRNGKLSVDLGAEALGRERLLKR